MVRWIKNILGEWTGSTEVSVWIDVQTPVFDSQMSKECISGVLKSPHMALDGLQQILESSDL